MAEGERVDDGRCCGGCAGARELEKGDWDLE